MSGYQQGDDKCPGEAGIPVDSKIPPTSRRNARIAELSMRTRGTEKNTARNGTGTRK